MPVRDGAAYDFCIPADPDYVIEHFGSGKQLMHRRSAPSVSISNGLRGRREALFLA
jgi:hypothetical protein